MSHNLAAFKTHPLHLGPTGQTYTFLTMNTLHILLDHFCLFVESFLNQMEQPPMPSPLIWHVALSII